MAEKKYYWLKLSKDFFKRHDIRIVEEMPNGKDYILFYLKLLVESIDHEGALRFSDAIPYNEQMLSVVTNTNIDIVRSAIKIFTELHMIEVYDDKTIYMTEVDKLIGRESAAADRMRRHRALQCNTDVTPCYADVTKCYTEIELDKEIDKEIETEREAAAKPQLPPPDEKKVCHKYGQYQNVLLSDDDFEKLNAEFPNEWQERIERLSGYIASKGAKYKNHLATIRNWAKMDKERAKASAGHPPCVNPDDDNLDGIL